jgi:phage-related protein
MMYQLSMSVMVQKANVLADLLKNHGATAAHRFWYTGDNASKMNMKVCYYHWVMFN